MPGLSLPGMSGMPLPGMPGAPAPSRMSPEEMRAAAASMLSLTPAQLRAVDHLESVSYAHLSDNRISERVRGEIARLVMPLLEAEVARPGEFAVDDNPARGFIRELAALGHRDHESALSDFSSVLTTID